MCPLPGFLSLTTHLTKKHGASGAAPDPKDKVYPLAPAPAVNDSGEEMPHSHSIPRERDALRVRARPRDGGDDGVAVSVVRAYARGVEPRGTYRLAERAPYAFSSVSPLCVSSANKPNTRARHLFSRRCQLGVVYATPRTPAGKLGQRNGSWALDTSSERDGACLASSAVASLAARLVSDRPAVRGRGGLVALLAFFHRYDCASAQRRPGGTVVWAEIVESFLSVS